MALRSAGWNDKPYENQNIKWTLGDPYIDVVRSVVATHVVCTQCNSRPFNNILAAGTYATDCYLRPSPAWKGFRI